MIIKSKEAIEYLIKSKVMYLIILLTIIGCSRIKQPTKFTSLFPHCIDSTMTYVGKVHDYYIYSTAEQNNSSDSKDIYVISIREDCGYVVKNSLTGMFAVLGYDELYSVNPEFHSKDQCEPYVTIWENAISKKWNKNYGRKEIKGAAPFYVVKTGYYDDISYVFYSDGVFEKYNNYEYLTFAMQEEERYYIRLTKSTNSYSLEKCNLTWTPIQKATQNQIKKDDIASLLLEFYKY